MPIVFGSDTGIQSSTYQTFVEQMSQDFARVAQGLKDAFTSMTGSIDYLNQRSPLEAVYVDDGFNNVPGTAFVGSQISGIDDIKTRQIVTQEPQLTVYIKKRAFWSFRTENDTKFLDKGDKLFLRATKTLFERKCSQIAAYESITKAGRLLSEDAQLDADRITAIADYLDSAYASVTAVVNAGPVNAVGAIGLTDAVNAELDKIKEQFQDITKMLAGIRKLSKDQRKLGAATTTNWVVDPDLADVAGIGRGSGVIELTCVSDINTSLPIEADGLGSVSFTLEDPYNLAKVTADDIELAIGAANNELGYKTERPTASLLLESARDKDATLQRARRNHQSNSGILGAFGVNDNSSVNASNKYDIVFEINPSSLAAYQVAAYVTSTTEPMNESNFRIVMSSLPNEARLTAEEDQLVTEIFKLLAEYTTTIMEQNAALIVDNQSKDVEYARKNLRMHYLGKSIVQPMDGIHVYIRSNTYANPEAVGPLSSMLNGTSFIRAFRNDDVASNAFLQEEMRQFGISELGIPIQLYRTLRTGSFMRNAGTHVFGGLISKVTESYNPDRGYSLSVFGESNKKWLALSRTNLSPSLDQTQGVLEDPLTPLDIEVDPGTGLIVSEPPLLQENQPDPNDKAPVRHTSGSYVGELVAFETLVQDTHSTGAKVIQHAPGLAYRWKNGIITATRNVNLRTTLDRSGVSAARLRREVGVNVVESPFSSMDAADVVSTLVTGFPHSYETFLTHTRDAGTYTYGADTNAPGGYFNSMLDILKSNNRAFGGFQPFKISNLTPDKMAERLKLQTDIGNSSSSIAKLRSEIAVLQDQIASLTPSGKVGVDAPPDRIRNQIIIDAQEKLAQKQRELDIALDTFMTDVSAGSQVGLRIYGSDLNVTIEAAETPEETNANIRKQRLKNEILQMRTQLNCKFNRDTNLFIVSDDYDKDLDIQAFVISMSKSVDMWKSEFKDPLTTCTQVANTLDMEFVCDSQGHLQFRTPKYNKTPLSLILKMMMLRQTQGKRLYPEFLDSLFKTQYQAVQIELQSINKQIEIQAMLLGYESRIGASGGLQIQSENNVAVVSELSTLNTGFSLASPRAAENLIKKRNELQTIKGGLNHTEINDANLAAATKELVRLNDSTQPNMYSARNAEVSKLSQLISQKQRLTDVVKKMESKNTDDPTKIRSTSMTPQNPDEMLRILGVMGDLIEDDYNDLLGPGSSQRFIITDDKLLSSDFTESDQNVFCRVDVTGGQNFIDEGNGNIAGVPQMWAGATDFDMWRQYGWKPLTEFNKPFFQDAERQCAPYAQMILTRARKNAVTGTVKVIGNEYYQVGDVVYLNSRDMLYYVTQVQHQFSYASASFTTTLELKMGHPLGEYIPTPMDVIGKTLIKNQNKFNNLVSYRQTAHKQFGVTKGTIIFDQNSSATDWSDLFVEMLSSQFALTNVAQLKNALLTINQNLQRPSQTAGYPKVEIRGFVDGSIPSSTVLSRMEAVRQWLTTTPAVVEGEEVVMLAPEDFVPIRAEAMVPVNSDLDPIDLTKFVEGNQGRQPSQEARSYKDHGIANCIDIVLIMEP